MTPGLQDQCSAAELWRLWNLRHLNQCSTIVTVLVWLRANLGNYLKMKLITFSGANIKEDGMCSFFKKRTHCIEYSKKKTNLHITSDWFYE